MKKNTLYASIITLLLFGCESKSDIASRAISRVSSTHEFNGYLYLFDHDEVVYSNGVRSSGIPGAPLQIDTKVRLASLSKLFTKIAILRLEEKGLIDLNQTVSDYRKGFRPSFGKIISIKDLLEMKSGLPRELNTSEPLYGLELDEQGMAGALLDTMPDFSLRFEPGSKQEYSNLNYWLLGAVIESVTGENIENACRQTIFKELGMTNTGLFEPAPMSIPAYTYSNKQWDIDTTRYYKRYASGGFYSTVGDLIKLSKSLNGNAFLSDQNKALLAQHNGRIEIYGALPAFSNMYIQDIEKGYTLIMLNNIGLKDLSAMPKLTSEIEKALGIKKAKQAKKKVQLSPMSKLSDSIRLEYGLKEWAEKVVRGPAEEIYHVIKQYAVEGSMDEADPTWKALNDLSTTTTNFRALGYRWMNEQEPKGIEVWFGSDEKGKIAIRWIPSKTQPDAVENIFIMPDDMEWMGKAY